MIGLRDVGASVIAAMAALFLLSSDGLAASPACSTKVERFLHPLNHVRAKIDHGQPITVVAIGSSSTAGAGATSKAGSYPSQLAAMLQARFPATPIKVINRGIGGEEETDMIARFERDVLAEKPDLVIWQVGSNAVVRERSLAMEEILIDVGTQRLKAMGADVVLLDLQYTPATLAREGTLPMIDIIKAQGRRSAVNVFHRYELMRDWHEVQNIPFETFSVPDGLHMNDWGYNCFARSFAATLGDAIAPRIASAHPHLAH